VHLNVKRPNTIGRKISKEKKSNSRDKFITFSGCDTELKHLIDINGECSNIAGATFGQFFFLNQSVCCSLF